MKWPFETFYLTTSCLNTTRIFKFYLSPAYISVAFVVSPEIMNICDAMCSFYWRKNTSAVNRVSFYIEVYFRELINNSNKLLY